MKSRFLSMFAAVALLGGLLAGLGGVAPTTAAPPPDNLDVYVGDLTADQLGALVELGIDRHELEVSRIPGERGAKGELRVEVIISGAQAKQLATQGVVMKPKRIEGQTVAQRATLAAAAGYEVFNTYAGPTGIRAEYEQAAAAHPTIAKALSIGKTVNGQDIIALKMFGGAAKDEGTLDMIALADAEALRDRVRHGARPAAEAAEAETDEPVLFAMDLPRLLLAGLFGFSLVFFAVITGALQQLDQLGLVNWSAWFTPERADRAVELFTMGMIAGLAGLVLALGLVAGVFRSVTRDFGFGWDSKYAGEPTIAGR